MNDRCRLIASLSAKGPVPVPLHPCCMTALVALHDRDRPDAVWLCPLEEPGQGQPQTQEQEHDQMQGQERHKEHDQKQGKELDPAGAP